MSTFEKLIPPSNIEDITLWGLVMTAGSTASLTYAFFCCCACSYSDFSRISACCRSKLCVLSLLVSPLFWNSCFLSLRPVGLLRSRSLLWTNGLILECWAFNSDLITFSLLLLLLFLELMNLLPSENALVYDWFWYDEDTFYSWTSFGLLHRAWMFFLPAWVSFALVWRGIVISKLCSFYSLISLRSKFMSIELGSDEWGSLWLFSNRLESLIDFELFETLLTPSVSLFFFL